MKNTEFFPIRVHSLACIVFIVFLFNVILPGQGFQNHLLSKQSDYGMSIVDLTSKEHLALQRVDMSSADFDVLLTRLGPNGQVITPAVRVGSDKKEFPRYLQKTFSADNKHNGYIIVGSTDYGNENRNTDAFLIYTNLLGEVKWSRRYGRNGTSETGLFVIQMPDRGYVVAGYAKESKRDSSVYVFRTDEDGKTLWNRVFKTNAPSSARSIEFLPGFANGQLFIAGTVKNKAGDSDVLLLNLEPHTGQINWAKRYWHKSGINESGKGICLVKSNQRIVITGVAGKDEFTMMTRLDGAAEWGIRYSDGTHIFEPAGVVRADADGNSLIVGGTAIGKNAGWAYFHKIVAANGANLACQKYYLDTVAVMLNDVRQTYNGGFTAIGSFYSIRDAYILRTNDRLETPASCAPIILKIKTTEGIGSANVAFTYANSDISDFPVRALKFELSEHRCFSLGN